MSRRRRAGVRPPVQEAQAHQGGEGGEDEPTGHVGEVVLVDQQRRGDDEQAPRRGDGAGAAVSDSMVDAIDVLGDADLVRRTVQSHLDGGVDVPVVMPMPWGADRMQIVHDTMAAAITAR